MKKFFQLDEITQSLQEVSKQHANVSGNGPLDKILNSPVQMQKISNDCLKGKHRFTVYKQKLFVKGAKKHPREISVPSFLDQAILKALDRSLKTACPISNQTPLAFFVIQDLKDSFVNLPEDTCIMRLDIQQYFDSIKHDILLSKLEDKSCPDWISALTKAAIKTPAKEKSEKTPEKKQIGVPQGISISSYLADLYLEDFDDEVKKTCIKYCRYVDDILILYKKSQEDIITAFLKEKLDNLGLSFHDTGTKFFKGSVFAKEGFDFLGYQFHVSKDDLLVTVRNSSVQKFINSAIDIITKYKKGGYDHQYGDPLLALDALRYDLNEKITGAFKDDRRYGWLWYFRQMNDLALLDKIDRIIKRELAKDRRFNGLKIKRLKRAFYEIKNFGGGSSYILNYGLSDPALIKKYFSHLDGGIKRSNSPEAVLAAFNRFTNKRLKRLMLDEVRAS